MKRSIMQAYVNGSVEAVKLYQKAFDATLGLIGKNKMVHMSTRSLTCMADIGDIRSARQKSRKQYAVLLTF